MTPVLSICIASYNKVELTEKLVKSILVNQNEKLGVIVVDNASTDETVSKLLKINDARMSVVANDCNIGGAANMVRAIYSGGGYCLYCNDRDLIYPDKLDSLIGFLETHPDYSCGWVCRTKPGLLEEYTEYNTVDAFVSMCWRCEHPTGFFFNSKFLHEYPEESWKEYISSQGWTAFPFENIQAELVTKGKFVRYNTPVWHSTGNETHNRYVSEFEKLNTDGDRWFYPGNCINRGEAYLNQFWHIIRQYHINVDEATRYSIYSNIILGEQKIGVWRYKSIFESESLAYHYAVKPKKVSNEELNKLNQQIVNGLVGTVRGYEGGKRESENQIRNAITASDKCYKKIFFFQKITSLKVVRLLRGKH